MEIRGEYSDIGDKAALVAARGASIIFVERLAEIGVDIADIGRPIVDAPLLDMRLDVANVPAEVL